MKVVPLRLQPGDDLRQALERWLPASGPEARGDTCLSLEVLRNIWQSIDLYFHRFEFNASVYYLLRWLGFLGL